MPYEIIITGVDELVAKFNQGDKQAGVELLRAVNESLDLVQKDGEEYPAETAANAPPPPFYIRGTGTQYANGANRSESRQMGSRWKKSIQAVKDGIQGSVGIPDSLVPYAKYVMGWRLQASWHALNQWATDEKIAQRQTPKIVQNFQDAAKRLANFLNR